MNRLRNEKAVDQNAGTIDQIVIPIDQNARTIDQNENTIDQNAGTIDQNENTIDQNAATIDQNEKTINQNGKTIDQNENSIDQNGVFAMEMNVTDLFTTVYKIRMSWSDGYVTEKMVIEGSEIRDLGMLEDRADKGL